MVETLVRPVTHTPAELRADLSTVRDYDRDYFPNGNRAWTGVHSWWALANSSRHISHGGGLTGRLIEAAHFENDWHDALIEDQTRSQVGTDEEDWTQIDGEIHAEFPGPIQDQKLAKLRELAKERQNLRRRVVDLETERHAEITDPKDPRMLPLLIKAAQEADTQGYCSVYDQISNAVGFPTRDEMKAQGYLTRIYDVRVRVEMAGQYVTVQVEATDERDAMRSVMSWDNDGIAEYIDGNDPEISSWEARSANLSNN